MQNLTFLVLVFLAESVKSSSRLQENSNNCHYTFIVAAEGQNACIRNVENNPLISSGSNSKSKNSDNASPSEYSNDNQNPRRKRSKKVRRTSRSARIREVTKRVEEIASATETYTKHVNQLAQQNKNMDDRVTQVYLQLLHEIVEKRDVDLDLKKLESQLFNKTSQFLELEKNFYKLQAQHERLLRITIQQAENLDRVQKSVKIIQNDRHSSSENSMVDSPVSNKIATQEAFSREQSFEKEPSENRNTHSSSKVHFRDDEYIEPIPDVTALQDLSQRTVQSCLKGFQIDGLRQNCIVTLGDREVVCDMTSGGWLVIQQRVGKKSGTTDFYRNWNDYKSGFGRLRANFWLGLDQIHELTKLKEYKLRIDMYDWKNEHVYAEYDRFSVSNENDGFRLRLGSYKGSAGDSLSIHNNQQFTTKDRDNDPMIQNCANYQGGGWWYNRCADANLNGKFYNNNAGFYSSTYQDGVYWASFRGVSYSLKLVQMKIREV